MSYNFVENITLEIPNVEEQLAANFSEADRSNKGLIVEVAAIHAGETSNHTFYSKEALEAAVESWVSPYPKPVILNHDPHSEPVGRVIAAKMDKEADGTDFIRLQLAITDPTAVEKIVSQRYLTGSVGGKAEKATCSICGEDWAKASQFSAPCKHVRGRVYKGKRAAINMEGCSFKEYSWVNMPADALSGVREIGSVDTPAEAIDDDDWVRPARLFALSMDSEEMFEYTEAESHDVLADMKRKDAQALHMQLKGAYLNALAVEGSEEEDEDILAISEALSANLAASVEEEVEENDEEETDAPAEEEEVEAGEESEDAEESDEEADAEEGADNGQPAERTRPQGQEKVRPRDIDPERSTGAPLNRTSDDSEDQIAEDSDDTELSERIALLESQVEELEQASASLAEENARLKTALKRGLAERVVDTKISLGMISHEDRGDEIEEHLARSAASLADSLRDLVGLAPTKKVSNNYRDVPTVEENSRLGAVKSSDKEPIIEEGEEVPTTKKIDVVEMMTDVFMGRKKL